MPDTPIEKRDPPDYPRDMETRVAILEHIADETKTGLGEIKAIVRDLATEMREGFRAINAKFDGKFETTDRAIADLRVEIQATRAEFHAALNQNLVWTVGTIIILGLAVLGTLARIGHIF